MRSVILAVILAALLAALITFHPLHQKAEHGPLPRAPLSFLSEIA
jgi:hypothetical protein